MYHSRPTADSTESADPFPLEVLRLFRREREIAMVVYARGMVTAKDVGAAVSDSLSNPAVRSMLKRLVAKGILTCVKCGRRGTFAYGPALTQASARELALRQFAEDFYGGSLERLRDAISRLFISEHQSVGSIKSRKRARRQRRVDYLSPAMFQLPASQEVGAKPS
jgi:predicted transcriptional regulator